MRLLQGRAWPWVALGAALGILGFIVLDGVAAGVALAGAALALLVAVMRALSGADMSGTTHGGEGGLG